MSIFGKLFGQKKEPGDEDREYSSPGTTGSIDNPFDKEAGRTEIVMSSATEEVARNVAKGLSDLGEILKTVAGNIETQKNTAQTISENSRKQIEILEAMRDKMDGSLAGELDSASMEEITRTIKEELSLLKKLDESIIENNRNISSAFDNINDSLKVIPYAEERQGKILDAIESQGKNTGGLSMQLHEISDRLMQQVQSQERQASQVQESLDGVKKKISTQGVMNTVLLALIFVTILLGVIFAGVAAGIFN